jgi:DNA-binding transcriptional LysR family regulator
MEALRAAAVAGLGIVYMPDFLAHGAIDSRACRRCSTPIAPSPSSSHSLIVEPASVAEAQVFVDFACARLF